jgi:hypothetical protein
MNAPNAKTAAAARMQAPIVANNLLQDMDLVKRRVALQRLRLLPADRRKGQDRARGIRLRRQAAAELPDLVA